MNYDLQKLAASFSFTEGPASDKAGNAYFTDQPNDGPDWGGREEYIKNIS